ncbi:aminoglycoside N3'-acetyltransferase [Actinopolymorpha rutila]|uniref:Aminoglycoside N3'-acetyltransferase n=1 Tax=Actinopolymorpha rutila TaxID=446787 RepID=A0A852ZRL2_9ACTN|nr:aminoglycoside N3'-acetyltransferase [Actinopolymorpha rutila]
MDNRAAALIESSAMAEGAVVTEDEIAAGLRRLGLNESSSVIVHASLRSFGHVDGGAPAVCRHSSGPAER